MDNFPEIGNWTITYDSNQMPGVIIGQLANDFNEIPAGNPIVMSSPFSVDLITFTVVDRAGGKWKLVGKGFQSVLVDYLEPFNVVNFSMEDSEDDYSDDEEDEN